MPVMIKSNKSLIAQIIKLANKRLSMKEAKLFNQFAMLYYKNLPLREVKNTGVEDLYYLALSHWKQIKKKKPSDLKIKVFNPTIAKDGWRQSSRTVIQISTHNIPFLIDSVLMELSQLGYVTKLMLYMGGMEIARTPAGDVISTSSVDDNSLAASQEAPIAFLIDYEGDKVKLRQIKENLRQALYDVKVTVRDWPKMRGKMQNIISSVEKKEFVTKVKEKELDESKNFLQWLLADNFVFLGYREYTLVNHEDKGLALKLVKKSGLGVLADESRSTLYRMYSELPKEAREAALSEKTLLIISKTNTFSSVHRRVYTDYIGIKRFDENGELIGESRFIGLFTSLAYNTDPFDIPVLRSKVRQALLKSSFPLKSHGRKDLKHILINLPRDDLFCSSVDELYKLSINILQLQDRAEVRLFVSKDAYNRFISCLVYVPENRFSTDVLYEMKAVVEHEFKALSIRFSTDFTGPVLARIHFSIRVNPKTYRKISEAKLESKLEKIGLNWQDCLLNSLNNYFSQQKSVLLYNDYKNAFPAGYRESFSANYAVLDIVQIEKVCEREPMVMTFYRPPNRPCENFSLKLFHLNNTVPLSDVLPLLENMGLRVIGEQPYPIRVGKEKVVWINDFNMCCMRETSFDVDEVRDIFQDAFHAAWFGLSESDGFNLLVLEAGLNWIEIRVLRAYFKYLSQVGFRYSQQYVEQTLANNPAIASNLFRLFKHRFAPSCVKQKDNEKVIKGIQEEIQQALEKVVVLDEDRILRRYIDVIMATLRTNYYQLDAKSSHKSYLALKVDSHKVPDMPLPAPRYEIFVYSPFFEGVHLRMAKVARGGIRWSDRREDFRTEVLGLMKAQQVKNAVIVPAGAKGGFVLKRPPPASQGREAFLNEGVRCYKQFISGLLDLTDNRVGKRVVTSKNTIAYDEKDPYLVVAADKGTATFSDIANQLAIDRGYWLGDAFASGGKTGYDHKKIGITARGAWVSAEEHFSNLEINVEKDDVTVVGVGDMAGDVFGNGLLSSQHIKLVAAFNHQHIFIDPNPSASDSFKERKRLFLLPRSSWTDYNEKLISTGGGVFSRSAKSIHLSSQIKKLLQVEASSLEPNELIRAIMCAPVDLIWNGGIGTFVKSKGESNESVGDRGNDLLRVNGCELRAKAFCEGGNLGLTQLGRVEYSLNGGKINTDFIDNSAGVDCSDHEVNIKILLNSVVKAEELSERQRNNLLKKMTNEVAQLCLRHNLRQTEAITLAAIESSAYLPLYQRYMQSLEQQSLLNRELEFLPSEKIIQRRRAEKSGLARPELAVLLSYSKNILKDQLCATALPENKDLLFYLQEAFPAVLHKRFPGFLQQHHLRREIIATQVSNHIVSDMGSTFVYQMQDEQSNASVEDIVKAYVIASRVFHMDFNVSEINRVGHKANKEIRQKMMLEAIYLIRRAVRWFLRNRRNNLSVLTNVNQFGDLVIVLYNKLPKLLVGATKAAWDEKKESLVAQNVPERLATKSASVASVYHTLNIIDIAQAHEIDMFRVAKIYFTLMDQLNLLWLREQIDAYPSDSRWSVLVKANFKGDLDAIQRQLAVSVLKLKSDARTIPGCIKYWFSHHEKAISKIKTMIEDLTGAEKKEFDIMMVVLKELKTLSEL